MRELSATITRTGFSACAGLVCTLTTARMGDLPGGGKFWATFLRATFREETICFGGQKQNPRRSDDSSTRVRVYRNDVSGTSVELWELWDVWDRAFALRKCATWCNHLHHEPNMHSVSDVQKREAS